MDKNSLDFSFSGLKTSVRNVIAKQEEKEGAILSDEDIAASFQEATVDVLSFKVMLACKKENLKRIVVTGGVAANKSLRKRIISEGKKYQFKVFFPEPIFCTDNAAMIACAGFYKCRNKLPALNDYINLDAKAMFKL